MPVRYRLWDHEAATAAVRQARHKGRKAEHFRQKNARLERAAGAPRRADSARREVRP